MTNSIGTLTANVLKFELNLDKTDTTIHFADRYTLTVAQICSYKVQITHNPK